MLTITIPATELYDEANGEFIFVDEKNIQLEHSLISISKWESKWHKPFLSEEKKTGDEFVDYVRCMTLTNNVNPIVYKCLTGSNYKAISDYIDDSMTATWFSDDKKKSKKKKEVVTSELIYYWMVALNIDFECEKWHLNRLLTLIRICNIKNQPPKKMGKHEMSKKYSQLNAERRAKYHTKG